MVSAFEIGKGWRRQSPSYEKSVGSYLWCEKENFPCGRLKAYCPQKGADTVILLQSSLYIQYYLVKSKSGFLIGIL